VSGDNPRFLELRRRVQEDPASIAFAQLAEECRRAGHNDEAVAVCRAGLNHHPDYLSARVTLARAFLELGRLDEAESEITIVLASAADNLPANRALAEVHQKRGDLPAALKQFKRALELAKFDPDIEHEVHRIESVVSPPSQSPKQETTAAAIEDLFDFDALLSQLGGRTQPKADAPKPAVVLKPSPSPLDLLKLPVDDSDPLSVLERQLRENEELMAPRRAETVPPETPLPVFLAPEAELRERAILGELEGWLAAIIRDRNDRLSA
jgi:tetratricopeptide (TPR) repeat protein